MNYQLMFLSYINPSYFGVSYAFPKWVSFLFRALQMDIPMKKTQGTTSAEVPSADRHVAVVKKNHRKWSFLWENGAIENGVLMGFNGDSMGFNGIYDGLPSGKQTVCY